MGLWINCFGYGLEMQIHHGGIGFWCDNSRRDGPRRTSCAKQIGPVVTLVTRGAWAASLFGPDVRQGALLADAGLILEPDFDGLCLGCLWEGFAHDLGEVFLKASCSAGSASGCCGRTESLR